MVKINEGLLQQTGERNGCHLLADMVNRYTYYSVTTKKKAHIERWESNIYFTKTTNKIKDKITEKVKNLGELKL